jgi:O-antigen/teichoic acid export membrane protein
LSHAIAFLHRQKAASSSSPASELAPLRPVRTRARTIRFRFEDATLESAPIVHHAVIQTDQPKMQTPRHRVLSGSAFLLGGLGLATLTNFAYIIAVARLLGPIGFGHTTAVYTLLILVSAVTLSFQILTAKMVAQQGSPEQRALTYRGFHWRSWVAGIVVSLFLLLFRNAITRYLNLPDSILVALLAVGTTFYVPLGARRGYLQGVCNFRQFALDLIVEGFCRLCGSVLLIQFGLGVKGVVAANAAAVAIAYFFAQPKLSGRGEFIVEVPVSFRESLQAVVFFVGQVIINNCDIVVVKHFFAPADAGIYAAVALVGRVVFVFSWAVVTSMFPVAAETRSRRQDDHGVLGTSLLLVSGICSVFVVAIRLAPREIWMHLFGVRFGISDGNNIEHLLVLYAFSAGVYCLSIVLIAYEMSRKIANTGWVQLVFGGIVIAGIYRFHSSLAQVIWVQIVLMAILLLLVSIPYFVSVLVGAGDENRPVVPGLVRLSRPVQEAEVIAEFLKNDLGSPEFERYRDVMHKLVTEPDLKDDDQSEVRRAFFNIRHRSLWSELPDDTRWFEAEISVQDLHRLRVFPRAQWRKLALGDFGLNRISQRMLESVHRKRTPQAFQEKIEDLRCRLQEDAIPAGAVLLIGRHESGPFTILDGNHRLVAATLISPDMVEKFRFYCGLSPRMAECCWYETNLATLLRYASHRVRYLVRDPEDELVRLLQRSEEGAAQACAGRAS